jgi:hypothetical protein
MITLAVVAACFAGWLAFCLWLGGGCQNPLDRWRHDPTAEWWAAYLEERATRHGLTLDEQCDVDQWESSIHG